MAGAPDARRRGGNRRAANKRKPAGDGPTPARRLAIEITREVRQRDAYVRELIDARREASELPREEFDYAQVLCFGVVMCRGTLDHLINRNLNAPNDIKDNVRDCLRISAYELLFLHKPDHVVVSQGVEMVRYVASKAAGLGNAVLRKMVRDAAEFPWPNKGGAAGAFARTYGVPRWLADRFVAEYGHDEAEAVLKACLAPAPTYIVENPYAPGTRFPSDLAAQQAASMVPVQGTVLEIGAGRGTKTMLLQAKALRETGQATTVHTVDIHGFKERLLSERMEQMGVPNVVPHTGDARDLDAIEGLLPEYDTVFIDAPCSGTGTLRRHPEIRWNLTPEGVSELAALQAEMLQAAAGHVRVGGCIVYATCSILAEENQDVVRAFLARGAGERFEVVVAQSAFPEFDCAITDEGFFASRPAEGGPDGHFACIFRRIA